MDKIDALAALSALGHEARLEIFRFLVRAAPDGKHAGDVASHLDIRANTLSAHLMVLTNAGLIAGEREGRHIRYRANLDAMRGLMAFMLEDCCGGSPDLCRPILDELVCRC